MQLTTWFIIHDDFIMARLHKCTPRFLCVRGLTFCRESRSCCIGHATLMWCVFYAFLLRTGALHYQAVMDYDYETRAARQFYQGQLMNQLVILALLDPEKSFEVDMFQEDRKCRSFFLSTEFFLTIFMVVIGCREMENIWIFLWNTPVRSFQSIGYWGWCCSGHARRRCVFILPNSDFSFNLMAGPRTKVTESDHHLS